MTRYLICDTNKCELLNLNLTYKTLQDMPCWFQYWQKSTCFDWPLLCSTGLITLVRLMWKCMGLFFWKKSPYKLFVFLTDWCSYIVFKKIRAVLRSVKFLSPEAPLSLYKSTIRPCIKYFIFGLVPLAATLIC